MAKNVEMFSEIKARKDAAAALSLETARAKRYAQKISEVRTEYKKLTGNDYGSDGYFVFRFEIYEGWIEDLEEPGNWKVRSVAVDEQGNQFKAVGPDGVAYATQWEPRNWSGDRKPEKGKASEKPKNEPEKKAVTKSFILDPTTTDTLIELADMLGKTETDVLRMAIHNMGVEYDIVEGSLQD